MSFFLLLRRHAAVVWLATGVLAALGVVAALSLPSGIYPEVEFPRVVVVARGGGAPADVFLTSVTRPLEQSMANVLGVARIRSRSIRGATEISLQFAPGTDMQRAFQMVQAKVAEERSALPAATDVFVDRITTGSFPVVTFNVAGPSDPRELRELAEHAVRPALANVPGVGRIEVLGGDVREIEIVLNPEATAGLHASAASVADRLRTAFGLRAVGRVERERQLVTVLGDAQPKTLSEIADLPIAIAPSGVVVPLRAIAEVVEGHEDRLVRVGGPRTETVGISVARLPGASTPDVVDRCLESVAALRPSFPPGVTVESVYDQASLVRDSMASVRDAIVLGVLLCAGVIALFLRDWRAGLLAGAAVPVTLAISFGVMRLAGQTLNLMSLGGMAVSIGLVVDDAIVVVESIAHHRDRGAKGSEAATRGALELAPAVVGTTLTTVVVFVPLAFLQGIVGDFFRALAFTVTAAVLVSLAVALTIIPLAAGFALAGRARATPPARTARYERLVKRAASAPFAALAVYAVVVAAGFAVAPHLGQGFLPTMDEGAFVVDYYLPAGTSLASTEGFALKLQSALRATPEVRSYTRRTGAEMGPVTATEQNRGDLMVRLVGRSLRSRSADAIIADLRDRVEHEIPEARVEFVQVLQDVLNDLSGNPRPIEVKIFGPDFNTLHALGARISDRLKGVPGLVDLYDGNEQDVPELRFVTKRDAATRLGLTPDDVSTELETALVGGNVGAVRRFDRLIGVRVRYPDPVRFDPARVLDLPLSARGTSTTFAAVTEPIFDTAPSVRLHEALGPTVDVTADHSGRDLGSVSSDVERVVSQIPLPAGYRVALGGQIDAERSTLRQLALVAAAAALLVLTVLAAQFRRLRLAGLVLGTIPIAVVGALVALWVTATALNASSLMGCVLLVGLVVKNGVLLLESAERHAHEGLGAVEAVARATERRLRPVLMTTVATLAGLLPLALGIGAGSELQRPLAVAVIGGLVTSTIATLGLLPPFAARALGAARRDGPSPNRP